MSFIRTHTVTVTTDASGDATAYTGEINGVLSHIVYVKDDFATGVDFTITAEKTGQNIWVESDVNASAVRAPRQPTHSQTGVPLDYAASGSLVESDIAIDGRIKIVIAQGGNAASGTFHIIEK